MEKFMLINRKTGMDLSANASAMEKWILSLKASGNYVNGVSVAGKSEYAGAENLINDKSSGEANDNILRIETILAEDVDQASVIAQGCPLVAQGLAVIEVRMIVPLVR